MEILIFDMDGVLLKPHGYHRALQDTVLLASQELGYGNDTLSDNQIARFESLGISNELHTSAMCIAMLTLRHQTGKANGRLDLEPLYESIATQPISGDPRKRGEIAIAEVARQTDVPPDQVVALVQLSEQIEHSLTFNLFESMILGDELFSQIHHKPSHLQTESYLKLFDQRIITQETAAGLGIWLEHPDNGAAIMTNRPSFGPENFLGAPDASLGTELIELTHLPLIGFGEACWLAHQASRPDTEITKPNPEHALVSILAASGWNVEASLKFISRPFAEWDIAVLEPLRGAQITVFEDTPAGIISVQAAGELLNRAGLDVNIHKIGIAGEAAKIAALEAVGAEIFPEINQALDSLNHF